MNNKLFKQFRKYSKDRPEEKQEIAGILGLPVTSKTVQVPGRYGYVYVRLRNTNEIVQVFNDKVSAVYDLPVLLNWVGGIYKITSRDSKRYASWGASSSFLPEHSHYFVPSIAIQDEGLSIGTGTTLNFVGDNVTATMVGDIARIAITDSTGNQPVTGSIVFLDEGVIKGSATILDIVGINADVSISGTVARLFITGSASASPPVTGSIVFQDEGVNQGSALILNVVGVNADVSVSGTVARLFITGSTSGGGTPGGSSSQLQYNNAGAFAGTKIEYYEEAGIAQLQPANQTTTGSAGDEFYINAANGNGTGSGGALRLNGGGMQGEVAGANNARMILHGKNGETPGNAHIYGANTTGSAGGDIYLEPGYGTGTASYGMTKIVDPLSKYWGAFVVENISANREYSYPDKSGMVMLSTHDHVGGDGAQIPTNGIADDAVTYAKMQNVSATDKILGRSSAGAGNVEEIACTAAARSVLDDATVAAMLATLGGMGVAGGTFTGTITAPGVVISGGFLQLVRTAATIVSDAITADSSFIAVDVEGATGTVDNLVTINGQSAGRLLVIQSTNNGRDITVKNTGNIKVPSDRVLDNINDKLFLIADNTNWYELVFADNGA